MEENKKNKIPNVPNLRFSGFEPNYQKTKIGKCLKIKSGQDQKNVCCENGKYNIYGTGGVIGTTNTFLYDKESVGIGRKGTIDKPFYFDEPFWTVDTLFYSVINKGFSPKYIYYLFQTINWKKYNSSTGVPSLTSSTIESIDVYITSLKEQCKIAEFLTLIDVRIDTQNKIIEEYQALKNCIFDAIILESRKIGTCKINKIIEEYNVKTTIDNEYPVLSSTASGIYFQNEYFNKEAASENTTGYKCVPMGYCTYRSMSDTGRFYFNIQSITDVGIVSPAYPVFSVIEDSALFLVSVLNSDKTIINEILKLKAGGTRFSLPFKKLVELEVPWPDHQTRKHFMKMIRNIIQKIDLEQKILAKYTDQKNYLLNNMFI